MRSPLLMALSLACILTLTAWQPYEPPEPPTAVSDRAWQATADDSRADVIVTARGFPDLSLAQSLPTPSARRKAIVDALIAHADQAQSQLRADMAARGQNYSPLWITNQLLVKNADRATVQWLGTRADVTRVDLDEQMKGVERAMSGVERRLAPNSTPANPHSIEWGVARVDAPAVWALGYTGQGIVVANLDTGVRWDHDALKPKYRGWNGSVADHNYNWFDPTALAPAPVDVNGHGTHTVGTSVGDDGVGNQIGVAPGAQWIACRNMATAQGIGSVALYTACFQFALAPTDVAGHNPDPGKGADVTSNSWGCDPGFGEVGCEVPTALITATQVLRDAGVMVVASAGNKGSFCGTVVHAPATLAQAFAVGATDSSSNNLIASFSSRGPSSLTGQIKPDLVAPGVNVRSATFDTTSSYGSKSGTSMAAPHVAGVVALVWSAAPWLRGDVDATEAILRATSRPLTDATTCFGVPGSSVPNNTYGYGLIDARVAVTAALETAPTFSPPLAGVGELITFTVTSRNTLNKTLANVVVSSTLPAGASLISAMPPGILADDKVIWQAPSFAPSATLTLTFVISAAQPGPITSAAQLTYDGAGASIPGKPAVTLIFGHRLLTPIIAQGQ